MLIIYQFARVFRKTGSTYFTRFIIHSIRKFVVEKIQSQLSNVSHNYSVGIHRNVVMACISAQFIVFARFTAVIIFELIEYTANNAGKMFRRFPTLMFHDDDNFQQIYRRYLQYVIMRLYVVLRSRIRKLATIW